jgi:undecaprenyl-diphosphatase
LTVDVALFELVNGLAGGAPLLDGLMRLLVNDYLVPTALCLLAAGLWFSGDTPEERERNQRAVVFMLVAVLLANVLVKLCNLIYFRPRPFSVREVNLLFYRPSDSSLPSNAGAVGFAFAGVGWQRSRRLGVLMGILGTAFGFARIYCGVHYPLDVAAGALVGVVSAYVVGKAQRILEPLVAAIVAAGRRLYLA